MKVLAIIYDGFEELEATAPFALLRRAKINLLIASNKKSATGGHDITLDNLELLKNVNYQNYDVLLLPGGPHYKSLLNDKYVMTILKYFLENNKIVAAICAAPTLIGHLGYLKNRNYTCFTPLNEDFGGNYFNEGVVVDNNLITARSAASSIDFAYALIEKIAGKEKLEEIKKQLLL